MVTSALLQLGLHGVAVWGASLPMTVVVVGGFPIPVPALGLVRNTCGHWAEREKPPVATAVAVPG